IAILCASRASDAGLWKVPPDQPISAADVRKVKWRAPWRRCAVKSSPMRDRVFGRALCRAFQFSALNAFRLGFRELDPGTWLAAIQAREYVIRPYGWVRVIAGIQSLLSLYLVALWLLTYFGRPFE